MSRKMSQKIPKLRHAPANSCHLRIDRLNRAPGKRNPLLAAQQLQQYEHPHALVRSYGD
jgi:hypothetical protein